MSLPPDSAGDKDAEIDVYSLSGAHIGHVTMDSGDSLGDACLQDELKFSIRQAVESQLNSIFQQERLNMDIQHTNQQELEVHLLFALP